MRRRETVCRRRRHIRGRCDRAKSPIASIVISALRSLGRNRVDDKIIEHLRHRLSSPERKVLLRDARYSEDWILEAVKKLTTEKHGTDG